MGDKSIVICDDDVTLTYVLQHILGRKPDFKVATAANGEEGWLLIRESRPVLLFLDLDMPVKDGFAVLREMGRWPGRRPYTIVLSATESREVQAEAMALGADEVLTKPFKPSDILAKVERLLEDGVI